MEKLLPRSRPPLPRDVEPRLVEEKGRQEGFSKAQEPIYKSVVAEDTVKRQQSDTAGEKVRAAVNEAGEYMASASASSAAGGRLFVFRAPPEACDTVSVPKRKKKRNFLNLKKGSVAPTIL